MEKKELSILGTKIIIIKTYVGYSILPPKPTTKTDDAFNLFGTSMARNLGFSELPEAIDKESEIGESKVKKL